MSKKNYQKTTQQGSKEDTAPQLAFLPHLSEDLQQHIGGFQYIRFHAILEHFLQLWLKELQNKVQQNKSTSEYMAK